VASDAFARTVSNGWGSATTGGAYTPDGTAANYSVGGGTGNIVLPVAGNSRGASLTSVSVRDVDIRARIATDKLATGGGSQYAYLAVRQVGTSAYRPKLIFSPSGQVSVHAGVVVNGAENSLGTAVTLAGVTHAANAFIWLRAQVTGVNPTTIQVKAWPDGQAEPSTWQFTATNSASTLQAAGAVGVSTYMSSTITNAPVRFSFDDLSAVVGGTGSPPPPPPPTYATDQFTRTLSNGWGSASSGGSYTLEGNSANFSVGNGAGNMVLQGANFNRAAVLGATSARDVDMRFRVRLDKVPAGGSIYAYGIVRQSGTSAYQPKLIVTAGGAMRLHCGVVINGVESSVAPAVTLNLPNYVANSWVWVRAQVTGASPTTIRIKAWLDGAAEPGAWAFTATESSAAVQSAGAMGLRAVFGAGATNAPLTVSFDDFAVSAP